MPARWVSVLGLLVAVACAARSVGAETTAVVQAGEVSPAEMPSLPFRTLMLARDPEVQAELRLSPEQTRQVATAVEGVDQPFWLLRDAPPAQAGGKLDALAGQFRKQLDSVLTAEQRARFDQIVLQSRGYRALISSEWVQRLQLSADQTARIRELLIAGTQAMPANHAEHDTPAVVKASIASSGNSGGATPQAIAAVLNAQQLKSLSTLAGSAFDLGRVRQVGCVAPELRGVTTWLNGGPTTLESLRGKVTVVHFWAFGCINCVRNLPHYQAWYEKVPRSKLTIIGIHTPETERERDIDSLRQNVNERGIDYPVAVDGAAENWKAWGNQIWPAVYLIDKQGRVRFWWYGELNWQGGHGEVAMRKNIEQLLSEK